MKVLKKNLVWILLFVTIDQLIKFLILNYCMDADFAIISDYIRFQPVRNTNLSWLGCYFRLSSNPIFLYTLNVLGLIALPLVYNYFWNIMLADTQLSRILFSVLMGGYLCSFVDKIGGGSIDYIYLKGLFTFDLKDCYLSLWEVTAVIYLILHWKDLKNFKIRDIIKFYQKGKHESEERT